MAVREILLLGNPLLHKSCDEVRRDELESLGLVIQDLHDTLLDFRRRYNAGRAIAVPQIGVKKRLVYMHITDPIVLVNPVLDHLSPETFELWDDCMSFPDLFVRVRRHRSCRVTYRDLNWLGREEVLADDLSELLQHEIDHLNGILAVSRAVDGASFALRGQLQNCS